jgi:hypothetical protein
MTHPGRVFFGISGRPPARTAPLSPGPLQTARQCPTPPPPAPGAGATAVLAGPCCRCAQNKHGAPVVGPIWCGPGCRAAPPCQDSPRNEKRVVGDANADAQAPHHGLPSDLELAGARPGVQAADSMQVSMHSRSLRACDKVPRRRSRAGGAIASCGPAQAIVGAPQLVARHAGCAGTGPPAAGLRAAGAAATGAAWRPGVAGRHAHGLQSCGRPCSRRRRPCSRPAAGSVRTLEAAGAGQLTACPVPAGGRRRRRQRARCCSRSSARAPGSCGPRAAGRGCVPPAPRCRGGAGGGSHQPCLSGGCRVPRPPAAAMPRPQRQPGGGCASV